MNYDEAHNTICAKQCQCMRCNLDHYSLGAICQTIQQYHYNLNLSVKQTVKGRVIISVPLE